MAHECIESDRNTSNTEVDRPAYSTDAPPAYEQFGTTTDLSKAACRSSESTRGSSCSPQSLEQAGGTVTETEAQHGATRNVDHRPTTENERKCIHCCCSCICVLVGLIVGIVFAVKHARHERDPKTTASNVGGFSSSIDAILADITSIISVLDCEASDIMEPNDGAARPTC